MATGRPDAEIVAESLLKKGFKAMVSPVPGRLSTGSWLVRFETRPTFDTRTRLEVAGFKPYVRKY